MIEIFNPVEMKVEGNKVKCNKCGNEDYKINNVIYAFCFKCIERKFEELGIGVMEKINDYGEN